MHVSGLVGVARMSFPSMNGGAGYDPATIKRLVRGALMGGGCDDASAPLKAFIGPTSSVLIKPNWVSHRNESGRGLDALITHEEVLIAALEEVLRANPRRVLIGDAPIQSCRFGEVATPSMLRRIQALANEAAVPVEVIDFRRVRTKEGGLAHGVEEDLRRASDYTMFDVGTDSFLEPVSRSGTFRVTNYPPKRMAATHAAGVHKYLVCREALDADVVVSVPKLKTHRKAGITAALKNLVGINGNKEYLPHHRVGGSRWGGDCYEGGGIVARAAELMLDAANKDIGGRSYRDLVKVASRLAKASGRRGLDELEGAWFGNDTVWRMTLDLNRIAYFGTPSGTIADSPQRHVLSLTDAVTCGEGDGPLAPEPLFVGAITFARSTAAADCVHAALLGFDPQRIPLVREALVRRPGFFDIVDGAPSAVCDGRAFSPQQLREQFRVTAKEPRGWEGRLAFA